MYFEVNLKSHIVRLVKINKTNLINNFRSTNQCQKKEKESAEEDWLAKG